METESIVVSTTSSFLPPPFNPIQEYLSSLIQHVSYNLKLETKKLIQLQHSTALVNVLPIQWFQLLPMRLTRSLIQFLQLHSNLHFFSPLEYLQAMQVLWKTCSNSTFDPPCHSFSHSCFIQHIVTCHVAFQLMKSEHWVHILKEERSHWEQRWSHMAYRLCTWVVLLFQHHSLQQEQQQPSSSSSSSSSMNEEVNMDKLNELELQAFFIFGVIMLQTYMFNEQPLALNEFLKLMSFLRDRYKDASSSSSSFYKPFYLPLWAYLVFVLKKVFKFISLKKKENETHTKDNTDPFFIQVNVQRFFQALLDILQQFIGSFTLLTSSPLTCYILQTSVSCCFISLSLLKCMVHLYPYFTFQFISICQQYLSLLSSSSSSSSSSSFEPLDSPQLLFVSLNRVLFEVHCICYPTNVPNHFSIWFKKHWKPNSNKDKDQFTKNCNLNTMVNEMKDHLKRRFIHSTTINESNAFTLQEFHPFLL